MTEVVRTPKAVISSGTEAVEKGDFTGLKGVFSKIEKKDEPKKLTVWEKVKRDVKEILPFGPPGAIAASLTIRDRESRIKELDQKRLSG